MNATADPVLAVLERARKRLSSPERWTRKTYARTARNNATCSSDPSASCWCLSGALGRDVETDVNGAHALYYVQRVLNCNALALWNDDDARKFEEVRDALDGAIVLRKSEFPYA